MSNYIDKNLGRGEEIVKKAQLNSLFLLGKWICGICFFWLLFIPTIKAIVATIQFKNMELGITTKRVMGKTGVFNTKALDAPLNKIQNTSVTQTFWGKIFNYGTVVCQGANRNNITFRCVKNAESIKKAINELI